MIKILQDRATPTISFKHFYKTDTLIGTGTYKFRLYSQSEPVVTPQLATPTNVAIDGTTLSWDAVEDATSYDVYAGDTLIGNTDGGGQQLIDISNVSFNDSNLPTLLIANNLSVLPSDLYKSGMLNVFDNYNSMSLIEIYDSMNYASWDELPDYQKEMEPFVPYDENSEDFDPPVTAEDNIIYLSQYDKLSNRCLVYYNDSGTGSVAIDGELAVTITSDCLQNKTIADVICAVIDIETYEVKFFEFDSITNNTGVVTITSFGMYFIIDKII